MRHLRVTSEQNATKTPEATRSASNATDRAAPQTSADQLLYLQTMIGNAATVAQLQREEEKSPVYDAIASRGSSLEHKTRERMEQHLGADFSDVRVHVDDRSTKAVQASAYTVGNDIVVNPEQFSPGTPEADHTLAHELTHVVQQRQGPVAGTPRDGGISVSDPSDRFEVEAESSAQEFSAQSGRSRGAK